jgi:MATE family multidrug resistance protein
VSFLLGLGSGVQATASRRLGEGKEGETAVGLNGALVLVLALGIPMSALGYHFAPQIFALLNDDPEVVKLGGAYLAARFWGRRWRRRTRRFGGSGTGPTARSTT